jgi:opacity protein-like surface antigen
MKKILVLILTLALALASASAASAAVKITKIYFNSPGADSGANKSLNAEYVQIKNTGTRRAYLAGWTLRDVSRHVYRFPTFKLSPGKSVRVHTGKGTNTATNLYWRLDNYVWNNTGDTAILRRKNGTLASKCSYSGAGSYKIC